MKTSKHTKATRYRPSHIYMYNVCTHYPQVFLQIRMDPTSGWSAQTQKPQECRLRVEWREFTTFARRNKACVFCELT